MSLNDVMKNHMDAVRDVTGASGLLSMAMATDALKNFNVFEGKDLPFNTDFNELDKPGVYSAWLKVMENSPIDHPDQGSMVLVISADDWMAQLLITFDSGFYYRADKVNEIKAGKTPWTKLGGVINPVLLAFKRVVAPLMGGVAYVA